MPVNIDKSRPHWHIKDIVKVMTLNDFQQVLAIARFSLKNY